MMGVNIIGVVVRQALKCSASEALNAESYNNPTETNKCRVLCPHNTKERGA